MVSLKFNFFLLCALYLYCVCVCFAEWNFDRKTQPTKHIQKKISFKALQYGQETKKKDCLEDECIESTILCRREIYNHERCNFTEKSKAKSKKIWKEAWRMNDKTPKDIKLNDKRPSYINNIEENISVSVECV